jgi:hypothetical protein
VDHNVIATEYFKKGKFHDGQRGIYDYTDSSHIVLVSPALLNLVNAEKMTLSQTTCNAPQLASVKGAGYDDGLESLSRYIKEAVAPYFSRIDLSGIDNTITISGEISVRGDMVNMKSKGTMNDDIARNLVLKLKWIPQMHPATVNGKPVTQRFTISFVIYNSYYRFSYQMEAIKR